MRIFADCYELQSELYREVWEMGKLIHPESMQNLDVKEDTNFMTKEIINYSYCLLSRDKDEFLFLEESEVNREWVKAEFKERVYNYSLNPGYAWKLREAIWAVFMKNGKQDYTYSERMFDKLPLILAHLKRNPNSRQAILSIWDRAIDIYGIGGKKRVPCSVYYQFILREGKLHIIYNQRSADIVTHFGNDVWLAWELMKYVASELGVPEGYLYHNITSLHCYKRDWSTLKRGISTLKIQK